MSLFKPIWENKNPEKIRKYIDKARSSNPYDQRALSEIALKCPYPDMRHAAAKKLNKTHYRISTITEAKKNGDLETVNVIIDGRGDWSDLYRAAHQAGDLELLSMLSLRTKTLEEWNRHREGFGPVLTKQGFDDAKSHYQALKSVEDEARREAARKKREAAKKKAHDAFLRNPREALIKAASKPSEKKLWREWFDDQFSASPSEVFFKVKHELKDLDWSSFFPIEYARQTILDCAERYAGEGYYAVESAEQDLNCFIQTLFEKRTEMREEILSLNGTLFYAGRESYAVNFGDHHEDWFVTFDALPAYRLLLSASGDTLRVRLEEASKGSMDVVQEEKRRSEY